MLFRSRLIYVAAPYTVLKQEQLDDPDGAFTAMVDGLQGFDCSPMSEALGQAMAQAGGRADG